MFVFKQPSFTDEAHLMIETITSLFVNQFNSYLSKLLIQLELNLKSRIINVKVDLLFMLFYIDIRIQRLIGGSLESP